LPDGSQAGVVEYRNGFEDHGIPDAAVAADDRLDDEGADDPGFPSVLRIDRIDPMNDPRRRDISAGAKGVAGVQDVSCRDGPGRMHFVDESASLPELDRHRRLAVGRL
jgi:hypothetical protein